MLTFNNNKRKKIRITFFSLLAVTLFFCTNNATAQLALNNTMTAQQLVQNILIGTGVTITNVTYSGVSQAIGAFSNGGTTNLGIQNGIILCSGNITTCIGPNSQSGAGTSNNIGGDPQLATLIPGYTVYDAAVIEFDFVPLSDTIMFRYVFGSEEYPEYVNSSFNDVFGFFISGPNPAGGNYLNKNMAIIPGTANTPVAINNVNNGTSNNGPCMNCAYYVNNTGGLTIQYDGLTTVLTAMVVVTPCMNYHFKIAVGDAGDHILDSGVFLEKNSFKTNAIQVETDYSVPGAGKIAIEGCNDAIIKFTLPKIAQDSFWIAIDSIFGTATNGVDFPLIPNSILILPGQGQGQIIVAPYVDGVIEGIEFLKIITQTSLCTVDTLIVPINDYTPMSVQTSNDTMVCYGTASLWVNVAAGAPPYKYTWTPSTGLSNPNIHNPFATPPTTTNYIIEVDDTTGCPPVYDSILVTVNPKPSVSFMPDKLNGCEPLSVVFTDISTPAIATWAWDFGDGNTDTTQNPTHIYNAGSYNVSLNVMTVDGCPDSLSIPNLINAYPLPNAFFEAVPPVTNLDNPTIQFNDKSSTIAIKWHWDFGDGTKSKDQNPEHTFVEGPYNVCLVVTTSHDCLDSICKEILIVVDDIEIPNVITPNGDGLNDVFEIKNAKKLDQATLIIFNRWGKKVFEADHYQNDWNGENCSDGVYYYIFKYETYFKEDEKHGTVTIIRE